MPDDVTARRTGVERQDLAGQSRHDTQAVLADAAALARRARRIALALAIAILLGTALWALQR
jgi:hypothetical protein